MYAKVSELKARLSHYLGRVRRGETVIVQDRSTPVAKIVPIDRAGLHLEEPTLSLESLKLRRVKLRKRIDVVALLREDRDQR